MREPVWIELEDCLAFHEGLLSRFGGLTGTRDLGLLESALARPRQLFRHEHPNLFEPAGAYAFGIAKNHPFLDGNKRSALMAAALFLECNGWEFQATEESAVENTLALAAGAIGEKAYVAWLKASCVRRR
jgi:death on curing protein